MKTYIGTKTLSEIAKEFKALVMGEVGFKVNVRKSVGTMSQYLTVSPKRGQMYFTEVEVLALYQLFADKGYYNVSGSYKHWNEVVMPERIKYHPATGTYALHVNLKEIVNN